MPSVGKEVDFTLTYNLLGENNGQRLKFSNKPHSSTSQQC
jgi:hypothetical protein